MRVAHVTRVLVLLTCTSCHMLLLPGLRCLLVSDVSRGAAQRLLRLDRRYVPRQHLLQQVIESAEAGDYGPVAQLLEVLRRPYSDQGPAAEQWRTPPEEHMIRPGVTCLSCSS